MRLLHTSDWHLGRMLHGLDLLPAQAEVLAQIRDLVAEPPDGVPIEAVIVAGDIYDRAVPPVEAVALFERTLAELAEHTTVIVSSGNHDSAIRLGFGARLFTDRIRLRTDLASIGTPVLLGPAGAPVAIYPLPYLDPDAARIALGGTDEPLARSHQAVMAAAMDRVRADLVTRPGHRCVVVAHAFVVGGQPSDSERSIAVGGVDSVAADTFAGADYVALGHLHGPQQPRSGTGTVLAYSGSPLRYSFSELAQAKSVNLVDLPPDGPATVTPVPLAQPRPMAMLTGTLAELLATDGYAEHWLSVTLTDRARPDRPIDRLRAKFPYLLHVEFVPAGLPPAYPSAQLPATGRDPRELAADFIAHVTGVAADTEELELFAQAYASALAEASAG